MAVGVLSFLLTKFRWGAVGLVSVIVFHFLDLLEAFLCNLHMLVDYLIEGEVKPCYCFSHKKKKIAATEEFRKEEISETLFVRSSLFSVVTKARAYMLLPIIEMLEGKAKRLHSRVPRWSDCDCKTCNSWSYFPSEGSLFVHVEDSEGNRAKEDVVFLHGFVSSSAFWTETVFPNFNDVTRSSYRLLAVDLLGFGTSPKPTNSDYTIREHVEMIESSVLKRYEVASFHIVAHSLGCILALALAARHPKAVRSITLVAPPYFPGGDGEGRTQAVMRQIAPRQVWPLTTLTVSIGFWYEHISRTFCFLVCRNHQLWETIFRVVTLNRIETFLIKGFFCHTHHAAWHTLHNVLCSSGEKMDSYLDTLQEKLGCDVAVFHGQDDKLIPVDCSYALRSNFPKVRLNVLDNEDHMTVVLRRNKAFARELEEIWNYASERYQRDIH